MKRTRSQALFTIASLAIAAIAASQASAAIIVIDDFNVDEGRFNLQPTFSGSTTGLAATSTADRITTDTFEGAGSEQLVFLDDATPGGASRVRFLSGGGTPANNLPIVTSAGIDGWIGLAVKTTTPGWTVQIWLETTPATTPANLGNNGSVPKAVIADGAWHIYQWNLDDASGGADGWGDIAGILGGSPTVVDGSHTIDSVLFRHTQTPATSTILMDWVVRNTDGVIVPEPASLALVGLAALGLIAARRRG